MKGFENRLPSSNLNKNSGIIKLSNHPGAIYDFEEKFKAYLWKEYKMLGVAISKCEEYIWPIIEPLRNGATSDEKIIHKKRIESQQEQMIRYENEKISVIGDILEHLDDSSISIMQIEPEFFEYQEKADPINLWKLIKYKHESSGAEKRAMKIQERKLLKDMKQLDNEIIDEFIKRYRRQLIRVKSADVVLDDDTIVADFLQNLNKSFSDCKMDIYNKPVDLPDFDSACRYVMKWEKTKLAIIDSDINNESDENFGPKILVNSIRNIPNQKGWISDDQWRKMNSNERRFHIKNRNSNKRKVSEPCMIHTGLGEHSIASTHKTEDCRLKIEFKNKRQKVNFVEIKESKNKDNDFCFMFMIKNSEKVNKSDNLNWILDSGASINVVNTPNLINNINKSYQSIESVTGDVSINFKGYNDIFGECLYVPSSKVNILSLSKARNNFNIEYNNQKDEFKLIHKSDKGLIFDFKNVNNVYKLYNLVEKETNLNKNEISNAIKSRNLHNSLNHPNNQYLIQGIKDGLYPELGLSPQDFENANKLYGPCNACMMGKMTHAPKNQVTNTTNIVGEHLHADIIFIKGSNGKKNAYVLCVDEASGFLHMVKLVNKNKVIDALNSISNWYKKYNHTVKVIHTDSERVFNFVNSINVEHEKSNPGDHEVFAERYVRILKDKARSTLYGLKFRLPYGLYQYLFMNVIMNMNDTPNFKSLKYKTTPRGLVMGINEPGRHLRTYFGMFVMFHEPTRNDDMDPKSNYGIVVGREVLSTGVKILHLKSRQIVVRNKIYEIPLTNEAIQVINAIADQGPVGIIDDILMIDRQVLPLSSDLNSMEMKMDDIITMRNDVLNKNDRNINYEIDIDKYIENKGNHAGVSNVDKDIDNDDEEEIINEELQHEEEDTCHHKGETVNDKDDIIDEKVDDLQDESDRYPKRRRKEIDYGKLSGVSKRNPSDDYLKRISSSNQSKDLILALAGDGKFDVMVDEVNDRFVKNVIDIINYEDENDNEFIRNDNFMDGDNNNNNNNIVYMTINDDPVTPENHHEAMIKEVKQIMNMNVWNGINYNDLNDNQKRKCIPSRGFSINKRGTDGQLIKVKGRLVAGGHRQVFDPTKVSSPTCNFDSVMIFLNICILNDWEIVVIDVAGAYLHAKLEDETYMWLDEPTTKATISIDKSYEKFINNNNGKILVKLNKALYGLHQSALCWYNELTSTLISIGYNISLYDAGIAIIKSNEGKLIGFTAIHVDDILAGGDMVTINKLLNGLESKYNKIEVQKGNTLQYLGMKLERNRENNIKSIFISQPGYTDEIIRTMIPPVEKVYETPYTSDILMIHSENNQQNKLNDKDKKFFRSQLMKLLFLTRSRADIKFPTIMLTTKMEEPTNNDMVHLQRIVGYLSGTSKLGITLKPNNYQLSCEADASFGIHKDGKGHNGGICYIGNSVYKVETSKQALVGKSSTECELISLNKIIEQIIWSKYLLEECGYKQNIIKIGQDNKSTITMAINGSGKVGRTKHINVRFYFVKQFIDNKDVELVYIPSIEMVADGLTKVLPRSEFVRWRKQILNE